MDSTAKSVAIVILNWNGKELLKQFLPSVIETIYPNYTIYVADNNSSDDSIEFVQQLYPSIKIISNPTNEGFAKGYNTALKQINADYYVLLNSDVEVTPNWVTPVIDLLESKSENTACTPDVLSYHQKSHYEYAGASGGYMDFLGYPFCRGRIFDDLEPINPKYKSSEEVFWASGAALFIKAERYHEVNGLDEDLFAHMEEIDLCWKLQNKGYKVLSCPESQVYHVGGGTLGKEKPQKTYLNFRNNLIIMIKNLGQQGLISTLLKRWILDMIAYAQFVAKGRIYHAFAINRAYFYIIGNWCNIWNKRINPPKDNSHLSGWHTNSIVLDAFLRGKKKFEDLDL